MIANFYIIPASFENNKNLSKDEIEDKIKNLAQDFKLIKQHKECNKIFVNPEIYTVFFINDVTIFDLLFNLEIEKRHIDRDVKLALQKIILESAETDVSVEEIIEAFLPNHNEAECYGLIAFNKIENVKDEYQMVYIYNSNGWYAFRRYFLGLYPHPHDGVYFIEECEIYFPNLFFHERNKKTVTNLLKGCSRSLVRHLAALNDMFIYSAQLKLNRAQTLKHFSVAAKLEEEATLEGDAARKKDLTFYFVNDENTQEKVCCEPHLKLCYSDNYPGDSSYSNDRRIYFHEGKPNIQNGKILIGHIGKHL
jgi:hypothetical protein